MSFRCCVRGVKWEIQLFPFPSEETESKRLSNLTERGLSGVNGTCVTTCLRGVGGQHHFRFAVVTPTFYKHPTSGADTAALLTQSHTIA